MWYVILGHDHENSLEARLRARPDHVARIRELAAQGRVLTAGPLPAIDAEDPGPAGYTGSLIVVNFPSLGEARAWAEADPYF
ncbi:MAG: YciI family protein, partial [Xanthomonadales bacterium]|nr:YciI family protein [Xanthomonadales bacterium]NIX12503.1 YciI family protein [Xanthomonadales bacterium]